MRIFDTSVQELRYKVLRELARNAWNDTLLEGIMDIPMIITPGKKPTMRCCVYKERAICAERVKLAIAGRVWVVEEVDRLCLKIYGFSIILTVF